MSVLFFSGVALSGGEASGAATADLPDEPRWDVLRLDELPGGRLILQPGVADCVVACVAPGDEAAPPGAVELHRVSADGAESWVLLEAGVAARVNGDTVIGGIRTLHDRDELSLLGAGGRIWFSAEQRPRITWIEGGGELRCPRCRGGFEGPLACVVVCPGCGLTHHQSEELPCWTGFMPQDSYSTCAMCSCETDLEARLKWLPQMH